MDLPNDDALRFLVSEYARLRAAHADALARPALVQPTAEFFPDAFHFDLPSVARLWQRVLAHAPLSADISVELAIQAPDGAEAGCGSLACGSTQAAAIATVVDLDEGYRVVLPSPHLASAEALTASLARSVGALVLQETGEEAPPTRSEVAAVACGFGVLLANGAAVWAKSCGGLRMAQATALSVEELTVALALFLAVHRVKPSAGRAHLGTTQRAAFDLAHDWVDSNPQIVEALRERPGVLEAGLFDLEPVRGALGRWLHKRRAARTADAPAPAPPAVSAERRRYLEDAKALVDEAFAEAPD